jgi:hypothetical protein
LNKDNKEASNGNSHINNAFKQDLIEKSSYNSHNNEKINLTNNVNGSVAKAVDDIVIESENLDQQK